MQTFAVRKGKNDFSPPEFPTLIRYGRADLSWTFTIEANCWYDSLGTDNLDWNKLGGITRATSANNVDSLLIAWRPLSTEPGYFQVCIYENIGKTNSPQEDDFRVVAAGERFSVAFKAVDGGQYDIYFYRFQNRPTISGGVTESFLDKGAYMEHWTTSRFRKPFTLFRRIGLWFGGNQPAPQEMYIRAQFKMEKS